MWLLCAHTKMTDDAFLRTPQSIIPPQQLKKQEQLQECAKNPYISLLKAAVLGSLPGQPLGTPQEVHIRSPIHRLLIYCGVREPYHQACWSCCYSENQPKHTTPGYLSTAFYELDCFLKRSTVSRQRIPGLVRTLTNVPLQDDFYLNLLSWSIRGHIALAKNSSVIILDSQGDQTLELSECSPSQIAATFPEITSVNWSPQGTLLAVGLKTGALQIWDVEVSKILRTLSPQGSQRIGSLAWQQNCNSEAGGGFSVLSCGSRDKSITNHDIRNHDSQISRWEAHRQEVCGVRWSGSYASTMLQGGCSGANDVSNMLASGGNDNKIFIWQLGYDTPLRKWDEHTAAVKALSWSPHQAGLLASGGGTNDRHLRFFDVLSGTCLGHIDTESQVCNLEWSLHDTQLVSSHGYTQHHLVRWDYPTKSKLSTLRGHTSRVLYMAQSPAGNNVVTGAGDETVRIWRVFNSE